MYGEIIDYRKLGASKKKETVVAISIVLLNGNLIGEEAMICSSELGSV